MLRRLIELAIVTTAYVVTARLGLHVASIGQSITLVWAPTGIALAALALGGRRLWPAIFLGAFIANAMTDVTLPTAVGIAAGNTLEAVTGTWLLARAGFDARLERIGDVLRLAGLAGALSTAVSAAVGVASLVASGALPIGAFPRAFGVWWIGDAMGNLLVAPLLLTWGRGFWPPRVPRIRWPRAVEAAVLVLVQVGFCSFALRAASPGDFQFAAKYIVFPLLVWAALRFGPRGVTASTLLVSAFGVAATTRGVGPFIGPTLNDSLFMVSTFMGVTALTALLLAAAVAERNHAIDAREDFISVASHELRTPLTPLRLSVESMKRIFAAGGPRDKVELALDRVERQTIRLSGLVDELLDVTRIRVHRVDINPTEVELVGLVRRVLDAHQQELARAGCSMELDAAEPVRGCWDPVRVEQVVVNLLTNATKFGAGKPIRVSVGVRDRWALLRVADHGKGISSRDQRVIFERFERGTEARQVGGLGLGLFIARSVVEAHGGEIRVESEPGTGATFSVRLPLDAALVVEHQPRR